ncbi:MAG: PEP-CTERM sorting domain-containing protein [Fibrella sp.]|nr:PEP-CTERM sorting domain-containing protein [Armatimonadota bacterium]
MIHRFSAGIIVASLLFLALPASAQFVTPTSYTLTPGEGTAQGGSFNYFDDGGTQLTDNILGVDNWTADLGNGPAQQWVGWIVANPAASFAFTAPVSISQVQIGFNRAQGAGIFLPPTVNINGQLFALTGTELADNTRGFVNFDVNFTGTTLPLSLVDGTGSAWIFVDEVRFVGAEVATVPEPSALALAIPALGMIGAMVVARRRKNPIK